MYCEKRCQLLEYKNENIVLRDQVLPSGTLEELEGKIRDLELKVLRLTAYNSDLINYNGKMSTTPVISMKVDASFLLLRSS